MGLKNRLTEFEACICYGLGENDDQKIMMKIKFFFNYHTHFSLIPYLNIRSLISLKCLRIQLSFDVLQVKI